MLRGRKVCLVSSGHVASNPRLVKEADALVEAGADVTVVACQTLESLKSHDARLSARRAWRFVPIDATPSAGRMPRVLAAMRQRVAAALPALLLRSGPLCEIAWSRLAGPLRSAAATCPADLYIAHNLAALPAAFHAARHHGARLGFDAEDWHSEELPDEPRFARLRGLARSLEQRYMPHCDYITASAPLIARAYSERFGMDVTCLLNVFPLRDRPPTPPLRRSRSIYWFSQTVGPGRGLERVVEALGRMATPVELHLRGMCGAGYREALAVLAHRAGMQGRVHFHDPADADDMVALAAEHDLGLSVETNENRSRASCLTNKIFTYLLAGTPVLLSDTPAQRQLAGQLGEAAILVELGNPQRIAAALDAWYSDEGRMRSSRAAAGALAVSRFNWDVEKRRFLQVVAAVVAA